MKDVILLEIQTISKAKLDIGDTKIIRDQGEKYEGEYNINPTFEKQTLPTNNKVLTKNVTIEAISVVKVSNESGGNTIIIGG